MKALTSAQRRHLVEMLPARPEDPPLFWRTRRGSAHNRCAVALERKGLVERIGDFSVWSFNNPSFGLTADGRQVAEGLRDG